MEKYTEYLKKFQIAIIILVVALVAIVFMIVKIVPEVQNIMQVQDDFQTQTDALSNAERKLENLKLEASRKKVEDNDLSKIFFKPINEGLDTEAVISDEFAEILQIMRNNKIKAKSVKYDYEPQDDNFVKFAANKFHVCKITAEVIANYSNFASFLKDMYKYNHFIDISSVEIFPYHKNNKILLINLELKLYAQKDAASLAAEADAAAEAKAFEEANAANDSAKKEAPNIEKQ